MPKLPTVSGKQARKALEHIGWQYDRQRGSHVVMTKPGQRLSLSIPMHRQLKPGMLRSLIRDAGLTVKQFQDLLNR